MIVFVEHAIQSLDVTDARIVNRRAELDQSARSRLRPDVEADGVVALARFAEQTVLLFYDVIVFGKRVQISRVQK